MEFRACSLKLGVAVQKERDGNDTQHLKTLNQAFARRERPRLQFLLFSSTLMMTVFNPGRQTSSLSNPRSVYSNPPFFSLPILFHCKV